MKTLKNLMVCLDLTEMDDILIRYTNFFCQLMSNHVEHVYFIHNIRFDYPDEADDILTRLDKPLADIIRDAIAEKAQTYFDEKATAAQVHIIIREAATTPHALAKMAQEKKIDLTITGKKNAYRGSGLVAEKLLSLAEFKSALLLVPEVARHAMQDLLVPTDFSKASRRSLETGIFFQRALGAALRCVHVFSIPQHYFPYIPVDDMEASMRKDAEKEWKKFDRELQKLDLQDIPCDFVFGRDRSTADIIYSHALRTGKDLILISSKGKGALTSFLVGSVAIRLIQHELQIPLLITK